MNKELIEKVKRAMLAMQRHSWEQSVASLSLIELGDDETAVLLAFDAVVNQAEDGRLALVGNPNGVADPASNYEPVLFAAKKTGEQSLFAAADKMKNYILHTAPKTKDGLVSHVNDGVQIWSDSYFMLPPFFAAAGMYKEAVDHIKGYRKILFDPAKKLYRHIWNDDKKQFDRDLFWGGGNGWAASGMARVLKSLPSNMEAERELLRGWVIELVESCLGYIREDGLFHDVIDDPSSFVETNLAQMLTYAIYSVEVGKWQNEKHIAYADIMRKAALNKIDSHGIVHGACGAPMFNSPGTSAEAQAFTLLMEAAALKAGR